MGLIIVLIFLVPIFIAFWVVRNLIRAVHGTIKLADWIGLMIEDKDERNRFLVHMKRRGIGMLVLLLSLLYVAVLVTIIATGK